MFDGCSPTTTIDGWPCLCGSLASIPSNDYLICCVTMEKIWVNFPKNRVPLGRIKRYGMWRRKTYIGREYWRECALSMRMPLPSMCNVPEKQFSKQIKYTTRQMRIGLLLFVASIDLLCEAFKNSISHCGPPRYPVPLLLCKRKCVANIILIIGAYENWNRIASLRITQVYAGRVCVVFNEIRVS